MCSIPGIGTLFGIPARLVLKIGGNAGEALIKLGKKYFPDAMETGSRLLKKAGGKVDDVWRWIQKKLGKAGVEGGTKSVREQLLDSVSNIKLKNCINETYRPGAKIGDGGLADAIRHELITGELVGGKTHITKGLERVRNLENIIAKQNLDSADLEIATYLLNDLKSALELGGH